MTVTYSLECASEKGWSFLRLLFRWRGSVYKMLYKDLAIFLFSYFAISLLYRCLMGGGQGETFERLVEFCKLGVDLIPLTFVLGFFVTLIVDRWWNNFLSIPWPDRAAMKIACFVPGNDERGRMIRRTLVRYLNLSFAIVLRDISSAAKKRFPTWEHLVIAGLMTKDELTQYLQIKDAYPNVYVYWTPILWAVNLLSSANEEGRLKSDSDFRTVHKEILSIRGRLGSLTSYDWITIPLVYTQVITIAVHSYFVLCLLGRQYITKYSPLDPSTVDLVFPCFTFLQFVFYMGWLKVAQVIMNPFGEDDDDFEVNYLLERHVRVSYQIVDDFYDTLPPLTRDTFWKDDSVDIPHTVASANLKNNPLVGSASNYYVPKRLQSIVEEQGEKIKQGSRRNSNKSISTDDIIDSLAA